MWNAQRMPLFEPILFSDSEDPTPIDREPASISFFLSLLNSLNFFRLRASQPWRYRIKSSCYSKEGDTVTYCICKQAETRTASLVHLCLCACAHMCVCLYAKKVWWKCSAKVRMPAFVTQWMYKMRQLWVFSYNIIKLKECKRVYQCTNYLSLPGWAWIWGNKYTCYLLNQEPFGSRKRRFFVRSLAKITNSPKWAELPII